MSRYEKRRGGGGRTGNGILAICLTLFIFSFSVVLVLNSRWLYYLDITLLGIEKSSGMPVAEIRANYDRLIDYNQFWYRGTLVFPTLKMSEHGAIHFAQVKRIFDVIEVGCIVTGVFSLAGIISKHRRRQDGYLKIAGVLAITIPAVLGILAALDWQKFFIRFHRIFFHNNYWLFDPDTDPVINILPENYFMHCAILILALIAAGAIVCLRMYRRRIRRQ